ncbi:MAG: glycosyltransferase family 2 protein [Bacteroidetes bacterium]|nr:glycosyltransferase family 2 protein [Bacteroidota bacterium]
MKIQKTLTITIPTWNRATLLEELLDQLISQVIFYKLENEIEIIISDNCSSDNTEMLALGYCNANSFLRYSKNDTNLGAKTNVIKSLYLANSKFVLLLGDDDRIRQDCLFEIITFLKNHQNTSILIDESKSKSKLATSTPITLEALLTNYYWYIGNASFFIFATRNLKYNIDKFGYDFFNECWPQSQLMILGNLMDQGDIYLKDINILNESKHDKVMIYSSFYLWRTCVLELLNAANDLKEYIPQSSYDACRRFMQTNIRQVFFNILQCGIFVDLPQDRYKTQKHIEEHLKYFSSIEKKHLSFIILVFKLPTTISRPLSNIFILFFKGIAGLKKKNSFVKSELIKRMMLTKDNVTLRKLEFEK